MKVPPTGLNRGVKGWARPSPFTPLPFGSLLFSFHLLRGSLVYPRLTWECLCSHFSIPQLPSHVPTNLQALTPTLPLKFKKNGGTYNCLGDATRGASKECPHPLLPPSPLGSWWPPVMGLVPPRPLRRLALVHDLSFSLTSATFAVSLLISPLLNTTSLLLDLISYS